MTDADYRVWNRDPSVEQRTFERVTGELPEMESAKQLRSLVGEVYVPGMKILDVGCAGGHYFKSLEDLGEDFSYIGVDSTDEYINFAANQFRHEPRAGFQIADVHQLPLAFDSKFDIVFCCNVLLHLPSIEIPLRNLITASKKYVFIRTLLSTNTHLSQFLYSDDRDELNRPADFVYQNTYSRDTVRRIVNAQCEGRVDFIEDRFDGAQINKEFSDFSNSQSAVTRVENGVQIAGSKVFEWEWVKVTKEPSSDDVTKAP